MRAISRGVAVLAVMALSAITAMPADAGIRTGSELPLAAGTAAQNGQPRTHKVTLITGDVVRVTALPDGRQAAAILSPNNDVAPGGYLKFEQDKELFLIPDAAAPYLAAGRLDRNLFNVTKLINEGYDDARGGALPLIATYGGPKQGTAKALARPAPAGSRKVRALASVGAVALAEDKKQARRFWEALDDDRTTTAARYAPQLAGGIAKIWLDRKANVSLDASVPQVGAPTAWADGYDGKGVKVAVLDTGIDANHPDVAGQIAEAKNFSGSPSTADKNGHGTHVASTVAGLGAASGGKRKGVAPGARLLIGKVMEDDGSGYLSSIIAGMEWGAANAKVVSMSLGAGSSDGTDPLSQAVNNLTASTGALFVIAAGNNGPGLATVATPGAADAALTVGAVDKADRLASFSSRGPRYGDYAVKPEITAPGVGIVAARAEGTLVSSAVDEHHARLSGTSMATPHVAGAAAILAQAHPDWTPEQLKAGLITTARTAADQTVYQQGGGRLDVARAVRQRVSASTGALSLGYHRGPYADARPVTRTVTYRNGSAREATLGLSVSVTTGTNPAADGMITVSPTSLTLPPGGSAQATVTLDLTKGELGTYGGWLTATEQGATGAPLTTAVGYTKEHKRLVRITAIGRDGAPAAPGYQSMVTIAGPEKGSWQWGYLGQDSTRTFEVRPGRYAVQGLVGTMDGPRSSPVESTAVAGRLFTVDRDVSVTLDARPAKDIVVQVPHQAETRERALTLRREIGQQAASITYMYGPWVTKFSAVPTPTVADDEIEVLSRTTLMEPQLRMRAISPDLALHPRILGSRGPDGTLVNGHHRLPVVYVGTGRPEDYQGRNVRGKIALIRERDDYAATAQVTNAAAAKAAIAIIVTKDGGWFYQALPYPLPIPTINLPLAEGNQLVKRLERGKVTLDLRGTPVSPYRYQLDVPFKGGIPDNLTKNVRPRELATVNNEYFAVKPGQVGGLAYYDLRPYDSYGLAFPMPVSFPLRQTHYLLANDTTYRQLVWSGFEAHAEEMMSPYKMYTPGTTVREQWFKGPLAPGTSVRWKPTQRTNDNLVLNVAEFLDTDPEHAVDSFGQVAAARVYRNGELVAERPHAYGTVPVGVAEPATYRVELDVTNGRPGWTFSTETFTAWTFRSTRGQKDVPVTLPLLSVGWNLGLDLNNAASGGKPFMLRLRPRHQAGVTPIPIKDAKVWVSYNDGGTWRRVSDLRASAGGYARGIKHPPKANTSGFVSLKVQITDRQGNRLEQTVIRAYALK